MGFEDIKAIRRGIETGRSRLQSSQSPTEEEMFPTSLYTKQKETLDSSGMMEAMRELARILGTTADEWGFQTSDDLSKEDPLHVDINWDERRRVGRYYPLEKNQIRVEFHPGRIKVKGGLFGSTTLTGKDIYDRELQVKALKKHIELRK